MLLLFSKDGYKAQTEKTKGLWRNSAPGSSPSAVAVGPSGHLITERKKNVVRKTGGLELEERECFLDVSCVMRVKTYP